MVLDIEPTEGKPKDESKPCGCRFCECDAKTPHESGICYLCRGGEGVALKPFPPAHHVGSIGSRRNKAKVVAE